MDGYTLAIETSNPAAGPTGRVTLGDDDSVLAGAGVALGRSAAAGDRHPVELLDEELLIDAGAGSDDLLGAIDRLCSRRGVAPKDIGRVAVSIGPGGYTGLRSAIAATKMIAEATGARVIAVPSASVAAWCLDVALAPALVCLASKADTTHVTLLPGARSGPWWEGAASALRSILGPAGQSAINGLLSHDRQWISASLPIGVIRAEHVEALRPRALVADRYLPLSIRAGAERVNALIVEPIFAASSVLSISDRLQPVHALSLAPVYPREPDAVSQWRQRGTPKPGQNAGF